MRMLITSNSDMTRTGCGGQPYMPVLHGFAPAVEMRSHLVVNLLEISPVIHHLCSLFHKEIKLFVFKALPRGCLYSCRPVRPSAPYSDVVVGGMAAGSISNFMVSDDMGVMALFSHLSWVQGTLTKCPQQVIFLCWVPKANVPS